MNQHTISSPAKLILFGEHAVLHGCPALAIPVFQNALELTYTPSNKHTFSTNISLPPKAQKHIQNDLQYLARACDIDLNASFHATFHIPPGSGLGASAAWATTLAKLAKALHPTIPQKTLLTVLQNLENTHHGGTASGIDHHTIWNNTPTLLHNKQLTTYPNNFIPQEIQNNCAIFFTGIPQESTAQMIHTTTPHIHSHDIQTLTKTITHFLASKKTPKIFTHTLNTCGLWLEQIHAVNPTFAKQCAEFRALNGAIKICGAGGFTSGSGFGILYHTDKKRINTWAKKYGFSLYTLKETISHDDFQKNKI